MIRLESLRYLQEVAKTKSINKAAESLFISKSALSTAMKNLENEFGVPLLERSVRGVVLTEAGEDIVEKANLLFNIIDRMKNDCRRYLTKRTEINVYTEPDFASTIFPSIMVGLRRTFFNSYIAFYSAEFDDIFVKVREKVNNIGMFLTYEDDRVFLKNKDLYSGVAFHIIDTFELAVISSKYSKYIPQSVTELTLKEIKDIPQVRLLNSWDESRRKQKKEDDAFFGDDNSNVSVSTDNNAVYFQAILSDFGIGLMLKMPILYGSSDRKQLRFIPLKDGAKMDLWLICNSELDNEQADKLVHSIKQTISNIY